MTLFDILRERLPGGPEEKQRREQILAASLEAFARGGRDATAELLKSRMTELEKRCDDGLTALENNL